MKVYIAPKFKDGVMGGIARVVDAQVKYLPEYNIEVVPTPDQADVLAVHATAWKNPSLNQRIVSHCHGLYWHEYEWQKWSHAVNREVIECLRKSDAVTAPSEWVANVIRRGMWLPNVSVINHGIDLDEWHQDTNGGYILWNKTRVDPICDPRPVNILANKLPDVKFRSTFGDRENNVQIIGELPYEDHKPFIQHAMLYLATARETFGIGTLEALACGVPIVGWNWAGQAEFINDSVGWLSPIGDYDDLARGIQRCIDKREELSINCMKLASQYQWRNVIKGYADLYTNLHASITHPAPKISVIMPSYGLVEYLEEAIRSVVEQGFDDYELVIVDDCSTDGSYLKAKAWESDHVRVCRTPSNQYLAGALNYGIEQAHGRYILPLDADNILGTGALKLLSEELDKHPELDIVYGKMKVIQPDGSPDTTVAGDGISTWPPNEFSYEKQLSHHNSIPSTSMYRRKVWDRVGGYRKRMRTAEDADFWCRAVTFGARPQKVTDAVTLIYRNRKDSMSNTVAEPPWESWYQYQLQPFAAQGSNAIHVQVPTYEPLAISVIIPVGPGHGDQGITDALDSVYAQTFTNWECIVVDDTDHEIRWLPSWVRRYSTNRFAAGSSAARNIGIAHAKAQCFVLLDADDYLEPQALEKLWEAWQQDTARYVYCDYYKNADEVVNIGEITPTSMLDSVQHPITCLYPTSVRDRISFDESMLVGEDWDYLLNVISSGVCPAYIKQPLVHYRLSSGNNRRGLKESREQIQQQLDTKWKEKIMGCGCRGTTSHAASASSNGFATRGANALNSNELVLVEFIKPLTAPLTYTGQVTNTEYRFGSDEGHKRRYVHRSDAEHLLNRPEFQLASVSTSDVENKSPVGV